MILSYTSLPTPSTVQYIYQILIDYAYNYVGIWSELQMRLRTEVMYSVDGLIPVFLLSMLLFYLHFIQQLNKRMFPKHIKISSAIF